MLQVFEDINNCWLSVEEGVDVRQELVMGINFWIRGYLSRVSVKSLYLPK